MDQIPSLEELLLFMVILMILERVRALHFLCLLIFEPYALSFLIQYFYGLISVVSGGHELSLSTGNAGGRIACGKKQFFILLHC